MSITLFCLVKGNTTANAFSVKIGRDEPISELKKAIKAEKQNDFAGVDADKLKLWKVNTPDDRNDLLSNLILQDKDELLATKKISKYFPDLPPEEHIHVLVNPSEYGGLGGTMFLTTEGDRDEPRKKRIKLEKLNEDLVKFWRALKNASCAKFLELSENTRFLGKEHGSSTLFIRKCYRDLQNVVFDNTINKLRVTGNPGIGKTFFGYYILYLLALQDATVVYDNYETRPIVFEGGNAFISDSDGIEVYLRDKAVWYIVDGKEPKDVNAKTILVCSPKKNYYRNFDKYKGVVTIRYMPTWKWEEISQCREKLYNGSVSSKIAKYRFEKWGGIPRFVLERANEKTHQDMLDGAIARCNMDIFDYIGENIGDDDVSHMLVHIHVNLPADDNDDDVDSDDTGDDFDIDDEKSSISRKIKKRMEKYRVFTGDDVDDDDEKPSTLRKFKEIMEVYKEEEKVMDKLNKIKSGSSVSQVQLAQNDDDNSDVDDKGKIKSSSQVLDKNGEVFYTKKVVKFASNYVMEMVIQRLESRIRQRLLEKTRAGAGSTLLGTSYEYIAHRILRNGGKFDIRPLNKYVNKNYCDPNAEVNLSSQENLLYFSRKKVDVIEDGMYYQPIETNFPSIDSIIAPDKVFQMTLAQNHPIKTSESIKIQKKRRSNPFLLYLKHLMNERPYNIEMKKYSKIATRSWKMLSKEEKDVWQRKYDISRDQNDQRVLLYRKDQIRKEEHFYFICKNCERSVGSNPSCNNCLIPSSTE